ncbi:protein mono-ADP-ribosyltransferase PARP11 [Kryptolebias marmoratus]|uniref:protein mono-ADP-ribosyltransferase PARP11 n=1 Tax=Kryptolebias marmoratus TaxID=37003 RepID=UPI0007F89E6B|nr:protein mono-ADP-ribosyltransferase PARP11 [Kryptolebias marmoratus]
MWAIGEVEYMDTDASWYWYYLADCGTWHKFEDDPDSPLRSEDIEHYYLKNSKSSFEISPTNKIDFSVMLHTDLTTGRQRRIQRCYDIEKSCSCFSAPPVFWEHFNPTVPYQVIPLSKLSPEYKTVEDYVMHEGLLNRSILSIRRIQNFDLWELYCRKKKQLMRIRGTKDIPERRLFHGTDRINLDCICKYNFDLRLAGQHSHLYGKGIYFALHASYAGKYSNIGPTHSLYSGWRGQQTKIIVLARVITGKIIAGQPEFIKPDDKNIDNTHDSCVNDINYPTIFVIFDPNQIYPEYLIEFI